MITQIKPKRSSVQGESTTLDIHPKLQVRLQLSRLLSNGMNSNYTSIINPSSSLVSSLASNAQESAQTGRSNADPSSNYHSQTGQRRRVQRRKTRPSSYQLYKEEQRSLKEAHSTKVNEWKAKYMTLRSEKEHSNRSSSISRTNSSSQNAGLHCRQLALPATPLQNIVAFRPISESRFRSTFIKTGEGKRRMVDNNTYMRKLKTKIQFYSLSTIITEREQTVRTPANALLPEPQSKEKQRGPERRRASMRPSKARLMVRSGGGQIVQCRPWSGFKQQFSNELSSYL